jgi:hypothetical protein
VFWAIHDYYICTFPAKIGFYVYCIFGHERREYKCTNQNIKVYKSGRKQSDKAAGD